MSGSLNVKSEPAWGLCQVENFARGPYYGLTGVFHEDGAMEFTQVLRTMFREENRCFIRVGYAVTSESGSLWQPQDAERETYRKASNILHTLSKVSTRR